MRFNLEPKHLKFPVIFVLTAAYMFVILKIHAAGDFFSHIEILFAFLRNNSFPIPPAYPFLIWALSGFQSSTFIMLAATNVALAAFITFKIWVIRQSVKRLVEDNERFRHYALLIAVCLAIAAPVYTFSGYFYLGTVSFNIWHSPTYMMMIPFSILLFMVTPGFVEKPGQHLVAVLLLAACNLLIKPSFLFAWIPSVFLYSLIYRYRNFKDFALITAVLFITGVMILLQYYLIYIRAEYDLIVRQNPDTSGVAIDFLGVWDFFLGFSGTPFALVMFASFLFPLTFLLLYSNSGRITEFSRMAVFIAITGVLFALLVAETGDRFYHGNFFWTAYSANMMLFLATAFNAVKIYNETRKVNWKVKVLAGVFLLHVVSGVAYMVHFAVTGVFL